VRSERYCPRSLHDVPAGTSEFQQGASCVSCTSRPRRFVQYDFRQESDPCAIRGRGGVPLGVSAITDVACRARSRDRTAAERIGAVSPGSRSCALRNRDGSGVRPCIAVPAGDHVQRQRSESWSRAVFASLRSREIVVSMRRAAREPDDVCQYAAEKSFVVEKKIRGRCSRRR
jgi:hypothetical protein